MIPSIAWAARLLNARHPRKLHAHVLLPPAELRGVDGDEEGLAAACFGALDDAAGYRAVLVDLFFIKRIKLIKRVKAFPRAEVAGGTYV